MGMKQFFRFLPNTITSLNVLSGSLSVVFAFNGHLAWAGALIFAAAFFDFFDGLSARLLGAYSAMGKELDSLADMISFGLAPAVITHILVKMQLAPHTALADMDAVQLFWVLSPLMMVVFSALRLAKFNIDTRQSESFIGLATPANAMVWASIPLILKYQPDVFYAHVFEMHGFILIIALFLSVLLVLELPMFSLKFKNLKFAENKIRFLFLGFALIMLICCKLAALPIIITGYILFSVFQFITSK